LKRKITGYLRLTRPANLVTSVADVLAGAAIAGALTTYAGSPVQPGPILLLCVATIGLYGGGVVFNDVFDAGLDAVERPERPIPSGLITVGEAALLGGSLLTAGILAAVAVSKQSALLALVIAVSALVYDKWGKHHPLLGPLNMGLCRGVNLLLGISIVVTAPAHSWYLAGIPIIYIASITMISRGEVHGGRSSLLRVAAALYLLVIAGISWFAWKNGTLPATALFLAPFAWMIFRPLVRAIRSPMGKNIGKAVKAGVLALILMNASWAASFDAFYAALLIALLLPLSLFLARIFAVT
jgi:4-hydroxybenzoate polyprenyltransferase